MKNNPQPRPDCNSGLELELARRRSIHHIHDGARILADAVYLIPNMEARVAVTGNHRHASDRGAPSGGLGGQAMNAACIPTPWQFCVHFYDNLSFEICPEDEQWA